MKKKIRYTWRFFHAIFMGRLWCTGISALPQPGPIQQLSMSFPSTFLIAIGFPQCMGASCLASHFWHFKVTFDGQSAGGFIAIPFMGFFIILLHVLFLLDFMTLAITS
jgi:hypothetical protein